MGFITTPPPRDEQRKRLYAAEREAKAFLRDMLPTVAEMQRFVDSILRSQYLQDHFGSRMLAPITVLGGQGQRDATAHCFMSEIVMPKGLRSKFVVIHEVTHLLTDRFYGEDLFAAHGEQFATFQLMLVNHFLSAEDCHDLLAAFARYNVAHSFSREGD